MFDFDTGPIADLTQHGVTMIRPNSVPIRNFQVFGERSSGTNFVSHIIDKHLDVARCKSYGWKHGFPSMSAISPRSLIVVLFREAEPWVRSMYNKPWHTTAQMRGLGFSDFIRAEWQTVIRGGINSKDQPVETKFWKPLQLDRDPLTGRPFANIMQLRNAKNRGFLSFAYRDCNAVLARYESVRDNPDAFLQEISDTFRIGRKSEYVPFQDVTGGGRWARRRKVKAPAQLSDDDRHFVLSELDLETEALIGYDYTAPARKAVAAA